MVKAWVARRWVENGGKESEKDRGAKLFISGEEGVGVSGMGWCGVGMLELFGSTRVFC